ncbi:MAG: lipopolysaccharide core heptose(I) kinase RfaP [Pseudomonadota bacterium]
MSRARAYVASDIAAPVARELERLFADDPFAGLDALPGEVYRRAPGRETRRVCIGGEAFFLKRHRGVGWREIAKNVLVGRAPVVGAGSEFEALQTLRAAGVRVPRPVAFAERGRNPARRESLLLLDAVEPSQSLEDLRFALAAGPAVGRRAALREVAAITRAMHACGVNHRDLYICHFLCAPQHADAPQDLTLIDLHRAQRRAAVPRRWRVKDLGALLFSAAALRLSRRDRLRFVRAYTGDLREALRDARALRLWRDVEARAAALGREARRKGLPE